MIEGAILRSIETARKEALAAERAGDKAKAAQRLHTVAELYLQLAKKTPGAELERARKEKAAEYLRLSRKMQRGEPLADAQAAEAGADGEGAPQTKEDKDLEKLRSAVNELLVVTPVTWPMIGGLEETKQEIKLALAISTARRPAGVKLSAWRTMLFYGPPGTGKTLLAAATSNALKPPPSEGAAPVKSCFFNVKVSNVLSKYFGESSRIVSELYGAARDISPSIIFLDEFESLTATRDGNDSGAERRILSTLLAELDGLAEKGRDDLFVMTIAATNRPWEIDPAVLSRFEKKILIPLPDADSRRRILEIMLPGRGFELTFPIAELLPLTDGYSGRELDRLVKDVTGKMVAETNVELVELFDRDPQAARDYQIQVRPLELADFQTAAQGIVPQTSPAEMARYIDWERGLE